jgi:hypothetical protein
MNRAKELMDIITRLHSELETVWEELKEIQAKCNHYNRVRVGGSASDVTECPDCGYHGLD